MISNTELCHAGVHLFNIRYWDSALPVLVKLGESVLVRYDPRNLSKVYVAGSDERHSVETLDRLFGRC